MVLPGAWSTASTASFTAAITARAPAVSLSPLPCSRMRRRVGVRALETSLAAWSALSLPNQCSSGTPLARASSIVLRWAGTQSTGGTPAARSLFH
eukprot:1711977-Heterocapsa_arctica.AAC.1